MVLALLFLILAAIIRMTLAILATISTTSRKTLKILGIIVLIFEIIGVAIIVGASIMIWNYQLHS